ncbi:MAG: LPS export ABC transporter ATP-binding protein [Halanaerobiales bacterium]
MTIRAKNLVKIYSKQRVVDEVNLEVKRGEIVGLLGPNGAGKTTTFYMVVGLIRPDEGTVYLDENDLTSLPMYKRARAGIGYLAQEASIFRKMTVKENLLSILEMQEEISKDKKYERANELMEEFHIKNLANRKSYKLSGGERRRVEIARSLTTNPSFILLDEPFSGVDPIAVNDIQNIISYLKNKGLGVLVTDHSVRETLSITDRAYIMHQGEILLSGSSDEVANSELAKKFYLGEKFSL